MKQNFEEIAKSKTDCCNHVQTQLDQLEHEINYREKIKFKQLTQQEEHAHRQLILEMKKDRDRCLSAVRADFRLKASDISNHTGIQLQEVTLIMEKRIRDDMLKIESTKPIEVTEQHDMVSLHSVWCSSLFLVTTYIFLS